MAVGMKSTGSPRETLVLRLDGKIVTLPEYIRDFFNSPPMLRIGFSLTRLKKWKRSYDWKEQNSRPVTGR